MQAGKRESGQLKYCHALGVTVDGVLDCQLDLLLQSHTQARYNRVSPDSLCLKTHDGIYHSNSAAIITAATLVTGELLVPFLPWIPTTPTLWLPQLQLCNSPNSNSNSNSELSELNSELNSGYRLNSEVYHLWADGREDSAFGIDCLAITRETGTLSSRACTLPSNVYSMAYMLQYV
jgi:hypothetical protein